MKAVVKIFSFLKKISGCW